MFTLTTSHDGKDYRPYFQNGRLRRYPTTQRAINASKQLLNNPKNNFHSIEVYDVSDNSQVAFVTKDTVDYFKPKKIEVSVTKRENTVPIDSLIETKSRTKEERIQFLKDCHEKHKKKVSENKQVIIDPFPSDENPSEFTPKLIELSIKMNDYKTLLDTEVSLLQKGYYWYPDEQNNIKVAPTYKVLEILNKKK